MSGCILFGFSLNFMFKGTFNFCLSWLGSIHRVGFKFNICDVYAATNLFKMLLKYRPEDKAQKRERLLKRAQEEAEGKAHDAKKPIVVKYGLNHVTYLIEQVLFYSITVKVYPIQPCRSLNSSFFPEQSTAGCDCP